MSGAENALHVELLEFSEVAAWGRERGVPVLFVTGQSCEPARSLGIGCLAKPYSEKVLKSALSAIDRHLQGERIKKLPAQLTLYEAADPA